jgi:hypothetical protein
LNLSDVTVVILSRGREDILSRTLRYWSKYNICVLVLHNTDNPIETCLLGSNIEYVVDRASYGERCGHISRLLKTRFAILSSDDELYLPSALFALKTQLEENPNLSSVGGLTIAIGKYGPRKTSIPCYTSMKSYKNLGVSSFERLTIHFSEENGYRTGAIYRLMRKELMSDLMDTFSEIGVISTPYIYEVTGEIIVASYGQSSYISNIYWIRNWINEPVGHSKWNRKMYFSMWAKDPEFKVEILEWSQTLRQLLNLTDEEFSKTLESVMKLRVQSEVNEIKRMSRHTIPIPENLKYLIRKVLWPETIPPDVATSLLSMEEMGAMFDREEILNAVDVIN